MLNFAEGFRDKVRILFEHFDHDKDGRLRYQELAALQTATNDAESDRLTKEMYVMACQSLNCHPDEGLSLEALKFTYAADGASIDEASMPSTASPLPLRAWTRASLTADLHHSAGSTRAASTAIPPPPSASTRARNEARVLRVGAPPPPPVRLVGTGASHPN